MKRNHTLLKIVTVLLTVAMSGYMFCGCSDSNTTASTEKVTEAVSAQEKLNNTGDILSKDETVYVLCGANGDVSKIIVSDWLKNGTEENKIRDLTDLSDVSTVKGNTSYSLDTDNMTVWDAEGGDVYYQGTSTQSLPANVSISYTLDGKSVTSDEMAGKSGKVTIRFDYTNSQYEMVEIDGVKTKIYVPFVMMSGMTLDNECFSNVEISNGKLINMGDTSVVIGFALPGMQDNFDISDQDFEIPNYVEITADVENFSFGSTMTLATNEMFNDIDVTDVDSIDELRDSMDDLTDGMTQLLDGSSLLYENLGLLLEKSTLLVDGINQIADGVSTLNTSGASLYDGTVSLRDNMASLNAGLKTLTSNNDTLNEGSKTVFESLLSMANSQLAEAGLDQLGITVPTLTMSNYDIVLEQLIAALDADTVYKAAYSKALATVTETVIASESEITSGVTEAVREQVEATVITQVRASVEEQVTETVKDQVTAATIQQATGYSVNEYEQYVAAGYVSEDDQTSIKNAIKQQMESETIQDTISSNVESQMKSDTIKATISSYVEAQMASEAIQSTITENVKAKEQSLIDTNMASDKVISQIAAAVKEVNDGAAKMVELKGQLDQYNLFYTGLLTYTAGVKDAYDGSQKLTDGCNTIASYMKQISDGLATLDNAVTELKTKASALPDGVSQLKDGAMQLSDGLKDLNEQGIQKLADFVNSDLNSLIARLQATSDVSKDYNNFSGISDGMNGSVKFIYKTDSIGD